MSATRSQQETPYADALIVHRDRIRHHFMTPGHGYEQGKLRDFFGHHTQLLDVPQLIHGIDIGDETAYAAALDLAAEAWGAHRTWFLTNGASQGNRMALMALASRGSRVLVQRNSHSSVFDGLVMSGLEPSYVSPHIDEVHGLAQVVTAEAVDEQLARGAVAGVIIVSPNYFGAVANIPDIARVCARHGVPLVVDASWGAHFGFHPELPESPLRQGADMVLTSIHKLGGSLTQTAMLHLADGPFAVELERPLASAYRLTESTSLNAMMLASLDIARSELATGNERIARSLAVARAIRERVRTTSGLRLAEDDFGHTPGVVGVDPLHIPIDVRGLGVSGTDLDHAMATGEEAAFVEISTPTTVVPIIGAGANPDGLGLIDAIVRTAAAMPRSGQQRREAPLPPIGDMRLTPRQAYLAPHELVPRDSAVGRIAADMLAAYPPGIPNVVPGEVITREAVEYLTAVAAAGGHIRGASDQQLSGILVCSEPRAS